MRSSQHSERCFIPVCNSTKQKIKNNGTSPIMIERCGILFVGYISSLNTKIEGGRTVTASTITIAEITEMERRWCGLCGDLCGLTHAHSYNGKLGKPNNTMLNKELYRIW